jgi:hypothetical protein
MLLALVTLTLGCSTTTKLSPELTQEIPETLPRLEGKTTRDILIWRKKAGATYKRCYDSREEILDAINE